MRYPLTYETVSPFHPLSCPPSLPGILFQRASQDCRAWLCRMAEMQGHHPSGRSRRHMYLYVYVDRLQADGSKVFCSKNIQIYNNVPAARNKAFS